MLIPYSKPETVRLPKRPPHPHFPTHCNIFHIYYTFWLSHLCLSDWKSWTKKYCRILFFTCSLPPPSLLQMSTPSFVFRFVRYLPALMRLMTKQKGIQTIPSGYDISNNRNNDDDWSDDDVKGQQKKMIMMMMMTKMGPNIFFVYYDQFFFHYSCYEYDCGEYEKKRNSANGGTRRGVRCLPVHLDVRCVTNYIYMRLLVEGI